VLALPEQAGKPAYPAEGNLEAIEKTAVGHLVIKRERASGIPHNKFLVLIHDDEAVAVWTGSTNITAGAIYGHSNVGHRVSDVRVAAAYLAYWDQLKSDPETPVLRTFDEEASVPEALPPTGTIELFSPRSGQGALRWFAKLMGEAKQAVFLTAPFGITTVLEDVLRAPRDYPRYVLLEKEDDHGAELRRADPDNQLIASAFVPGGGFGQFIEEGLTGLNKAVLFIHTKYLLVDPLTDDPLVITGSANFGPASVSSNDENMLVIRGDTRVADVYLTEFMRLFTHMRFRASTKKRPDERAPSPAEPAVSTPMWLDETDSWTKPYLDPDDPKFKERVFFAGV
jgi:phosphatidylserine/phosphatidylglycerophosphate/cardiolipin synthase-like enzyme